MNNDFSKKTLYLFTAEFPYGNKSETFIETEIEYLEKSFKKVYIIPAKKSEFRREISEKVSVINDFANLQFSKSEKLFKLIKNPLLLIKAFNSEIQNKGLKKVIRNIRFLLDHFAHESIIAERLKKSESFDYENSTFYNYWFCNFTIALSILKHKNNSIKLISRTHGYDLYDERWGDTGVPFRLFKIRNINKLFCISKKGQDYFRTRVPLQFHSKVEVSYLGVKQHPLKFDSIEKKDKTLISCSSLLTFKNVDGIVDLIKHSKQLISWVHFGDGPEKNKLLEKVKELPENISFDFKGHVAIAEINEFYQNNHIDLFISMSTSEGLPVSMMEAISFGIPILANNIGGIAELVVNDLTGFLLEAESDLKIKIDTFEQALEYKFDKNKILAFYNSKFNADNNYLDFVQRIKNVD